MTEDYQELTTPDDAEPRRSTPGSGRHAAGRLSLTRPAGGRNTPAPPTLLDRFLYLQVWQRWLVAVPAMLVFVILLATVADVAFASGRIHPGVRVSGVPVGGLSLDEARGRVGTQVSARTERPVTARRGNDTWTVEAAAVGVGVDVTASVDAAWTIGREPAFGTAVLSRFAAVFGGVDVTATVRSDRAKLDTLLAKIADKVDTPPKDAAVRIEGTEPKLVPSENGVGVDRADLGAKILAAFASEDRVVEVKVGQLPPNVSDADAQQALQDARRLLSGPVTVAWEQKTWKFEPSTIAKWIVFEAVEPGASEAPEPSGSSADVSSGVSIDASSGLPVKDDPIEPAAESTASVRPGRRVLKAAFGTAEVSSTIMPLSGVVGRPAVNAQFIADDGGVTIKPSQPGTGPDVGALIKDMQRTLLAESGDGRKVELRLTTMQPAITTEFARGMGIKERISKYTTTYNASQANRVNNIHTLADALNNKLIPPGGVFDFNKIVGERTAAKGYQEAPAIVNGKLVPQLGGGICQIGTTFFNSVFFSGLPVLERRNHSFYISHYPLGRDCTVTWGGPNLRWKNETSSWILVRASYTNSSVTISLYGTDPGYDVTYTTTPMTNIRAHSTVEIKDPKLPVGVRIVEDGGVDSGQVTVVRTVTKAGQVVRTDTFVSKYTAKEETVRVGTKPKAGTTPTTTPTTTTP